MKGNNDSMMMMKENINGNNINSNNINSNNIGLSRSLSGDEK